ncbi:MAG: hypothetical protein ABJB65_06735, partial [Chloroflexota bacterium]
MTTSTTKGTKVAEPTKAQKPMPPTRTAPTQKASAPRATTQPQTKPARAAAARPHKAEASAPRPQPKKAAEGEEGRALAQLLSRGKADGFITHDQ